MGSVQRCRGMNSGQRLRQRTGNKHWAIILFILGINFPPPGSAVVNNPFVGLLDNFLCRKGAVGGSRAPAAALSRWGASCPGSHRGEVCHVPRGGSALGPLQRLFRPPSSVATCLASALPPCKEEECLQACSSPPAPCSAPCLRTDLAPDAAFPKG